MTALALPNPATPVRTFQVLGDAGLLDGSGFRGKRAVLKVEKGGWVDCATIAFLACWGHAQRAKERKVMMVGDDDYLARMNVHKALGQLHRPKGPRRDERGRFLPVRLVHDLEQIDPAVRAVSEIFEQQMEDTGDLLVAMQWIVAEILENVILHAKTAHPAAICAQSFPKIDRIDLAICDVGQGLRASLAPRLPVSSAGQAIDLAVQRGVSASDEPGRGNGLAGTLEIARHNRATTVVWSEDALHTFAAGRDRGFQEIPKVPGTGISLQLSVRQPVRLEDTWLAEVTGFVLLREGETPGAHVMRVLDACSTVLARDGAREVVDALEERVLNGSLVRLDFSDIPFASTSFLDELLARPAQRLGLDRFRKSVEVAHMSKLTRRLADVAIARRLRDAGAIE